MPPTRRETVDLSGFPDLVVIYLGMRPRSLRGIRTLLQLGPQIAKAGAERPVGLCCTRTSSSRWCRRTSDAPVLAGLRFAGAVDAHAAAQAVVAGVPARVGRHGLLAGSSPGPGDAPAVLRAVPPDAVQRVSARQPDRYRRDNACYQEVRWAFGDGLLNSQGGRWLRQRRSVQPLFTHRVAGYAGAMAGPRPESDKEANMHPSADGGAHARGRDRREQEELRRLGQAMLLACIKEWDRQEHARVVALVEAEQAEQAAIDRARRTLSTGADGTAG